MSDFTNVLLSGGAIGADITFSDFAQSAGHSVIHFHFKGHNSKAPKETLVELTHEQLLIADEYLKKANKVLKRRFPTSNWFTNNLLRRNYYQIETSERCYAVSTIKDGLVQGGTAWACTLFTYVKHENKTCECYVYCQNASQWYKWNTFWEPIVAPPSPHGIYTGVGSRDLKENGFEAIRNLYLEKSS